MDNVACDQLARLVGGAASRHTTLGPRRPSELAAASGAAHTASAKTKKRKAIPGATP